MMNCRVARVVITFAALVSAPAVLLAKEEPKPVSPPMQVVIARSTAAGCEPQCMEWISAQGAIDGSTPQQFKKVLNTIGKRKLPIVIDSPGGSVDEALAIGRMIRAKGLDVIVTKTLFKPCEKTDTACTKLKVRSIHLATPMSRLSKCASSCAFILAAGTRRYVGASTYVGLHQIASFSINTKVLRTYRITTRIQYGVPVQLQKSLISEKKIAETKEAKPTSDATYSRITAYFVEMGISDTVMPILMSAPHSGIRWLRNAELTSTRLATDFLTGEQMLLPPKPLPGIPVAAVPGSPIAPSQIPSFGGMPACNPGAGVSVNCVPAMENLPPIPAMTPPMVVLPKPIEPTATTAAAPAPQPMPETAAAEASAPPVTKPRPVATSVKKSAETRSKPKDDAGDPFARSTR